MTFFRSLPLLLSVFLLAACGDGATTTDGGGTDGGAHDGSVSDMAGGDAGRSGDAGPTCGTDVDCDDGLYCTGVESCLPASSHADARGCVSPGDPCLAGQTCSETMHRCMTTSCTGTAGDADGDGHRSTDCGGDDCDDTDANRYPGNHEVCDTTNHDEDCDSATFGFRDNDSDTYADNRCCNVDAAGLQHCGIDCNDDNPGVHPSAPEVCNGMDDNCDGNVDEGVLATYYVDCDGDGHGERATDTPTCSMPLTMTGCSPPAHYSATNDDCNDMPAPALGAVAYPGHGESCDGVDNDCNGFVDDGLPMHTYCRDQDADGYVTTMCNMACSGAATYEDVTAMPAHDPALHPDKIDCNDMNAAVHPDAIDACGMDLDCISGVAAGGTMNYWLDCDNDGHATLSAMMMATCGAPPSPSASLCPAPAGSCRTSINPHWTVNMPSTSTADCDDFHDTVYPGAPILGCDAEDTDCVGGNEPVDDLDGDGSSSCACAMPDCDDAAPATHPGATEVPGDGVDENCDGQEDCFVDGDHDGDRSTTTVTSADIGCTMAGHVRASVLVDCCDTDALANHAVGVSTYFTTTDACGSFDYNCNGIDDVQFRTRATMCVYHMASDSCTGGVGWVSTIPGCAATASFSDGCGDSLCSFQVTTQTQACH